MRRTSSLVAALLGWVLVSSAIAPAAHAQCVPANCDDGDPCTSDFCVLGSCAHLPGSLCNDGNACTNDFCQPGTGACSHIGIICNDSNACTTEACNPTTGQCQTTSAVTCNDGNACTTESCNQFTGLCQTTSTVTCNDNDLCTTEACNPTTGQCQSTGTITCNDGNLCTTEVCNPTTGLCQSTGTVTCNDNNLCTSEACNMATGQCQTTSTIVCNDDNPCTTDVCNPTTGVCQTASNWCGDLSDLTLGIASRGSKFTFKRKKGGKPPAEYIKVTISGIVVTTTRSAVPEKVKVGVKAILTGEEAQLASLIYPLAKLTRGAGAATDLQNSGWDFDVVDTSRPCQDVLSSDECAALAHQLSKTIDASLATAPAAERDGFRQGAGLLGVPPDDCVFVP
jgi:hypothetical protein